MDTEKEFGKCPDCQVNPGERHVAYCDVTRCKYTGTQMLMCGFKISLDPGSTSGVELIETNDHECESSVWTGEWPGVKVCRDNGWYTTIIGIEGLTEDLNSVSQRAVWNPELEDWEARK